MTPPTADFNRPAEHRSLSAGAGGFWARGGPTRHDRPTAYRGLDVSAPADWREDRVSFPRCLSHVTDKVRELASLPDDWDGYGAKPIVPAMINTVCKFLTRLAKFHGELMLRPNTETECLVPHCAASSSGTVQLEWDFGGRSLELEFETATEIRYLKWWPGHDVTDEENSYPADDMAQSASLIRWVLSGDDAPAE